MRLGLTLPYTDQVPLELTRTFVQRADRLGYDTVWVAEAINTSFEHLCDVVSPEFHASVQKSKDIAAGAVLICAIGTTVLGLLVFLPYLV